MVVLGDIQENTPIQTDLFNPQCRDADKDKRLMRSLMVLIDAWVMAVSNLLRRELRQWEKTKKTGK